MPLSVFNGIAYGMVCCGEVQTYISDQKENLLLQFVVVSHVQACDCIGLLGFASQTSTDDKQH